MLLVTLFTFTAGLSIGSFLNVVAYRLPRGESLVSPGSHCPSCATAVKAYDNVPVLGWVHLRGKCRSCSGAISARYPVVELVTGLLYASVVVIKWDDPAAIVLGLTLVTLLIPVTLIDLDHRLILNKLTAPFAVAALAIGVAFAPDGVQEQVIAGAAAFLFFFLAALAYPRGMGMGDVKLAGVLGLYLGRAVAPAIFIALITGVLFGLAVIAQKGAEEGRKTAVPFGPFLALGALIALFVGDDVVDAYVDRF